MTNHQRYRDSMEAPMEALAVAMDELGFSKEPISDAQMVELVTKKLRTLHEIAGTVLSTGVLAAIMKEWP